MINLSKSNRGFITLTISLIIIILVTILSLMTGRMLMNQQRTASNQLRYKEALDAAQAGIDIALTRLSLKNDFRDDFSNTTGPFYQVTFGSDSGIQAGDGTLPVVTITSVGTAGYSSAAVDSDDSEAKVSIQQKAIIGNILSGAPDSPLTVAASMVASGNFSVAANPNGGGAGVPLSIWSSEEVDLGGSFSSCALQGVTFDENGYATSVCNSNIYSQSDNKDPDNGKKSDILDEDLNFPPNLLIYLFGVNSIDELINRDYTDKEILNDCSTIDESSTGLFIVDGACDLSGKDAVGTAENPIILVVMDGQLKANASTNIFGIVYVRSEDVSASIQANGGATLYGALIADKNVSVDIAAGGFNAIYDANVLSRIQSGSQFSYVARVSGTWRDSE